VDGARADHHHQAVILAVQDAVQRDARIGGRLLRRFRARKLADQVGRWRQFLHLADAQIIGTGHCCSPSDLKKIGVKKNRLIGRRFFGILLGLVLLRAPAATPPPWVGKLK
jgi:hypothetical protein